MKSGDQTPYAVRLVGVIPTIHISEGKMHEVQILEDLFRNPALIEGSRRAHSTAGATAVTCEIAIDKCFSPSCQVTPDLWSGWRSHNDLR